MKLLLCPECDDLFNLHFEIRTCRCGKSSGRYINDVNAEYRGKAIPIGFANSSLGSAIRRYKVDAGNHEFVAFTIPASAKSIIITRSS